LHELGQEFFRAQNYGIMSIIKAVSDYISSVLNRVTGMKILLVDSETVGIISMVLSQSQILEQEVFLVEVIDKLPGGENPDQGHNMKHLKSVAILRPSAANFIALSKELKSPRFSEYHLCMIFHVSSCYPSVSFHQRGTT
jgi:vacuolar protein sorting-associated protein 45